MSHKASGRILLLFALLVLAAFLAAGCASKKAAGPEVEERDKTGVHQGDIKAGGTSEIAATEMKAKETAPAPAEEPAPQAESAPAVEPEPATEPQAQAGGEPEGLSPEEREALLQDTEFTEGFSDEELGTEWMGEYESEEVETAELKPIYINDEFEPYNRAFFAFNDFFYIYLLEPVAQVYEITVWDNLRLGIRNFFYNLRYPVRLVNNLLQGKLVGAGQETGRFLVNTLFGFGGLMEPSQRFGRDLNPPPEDMGQTFGYWGIGNGCYFVWPVLGPSTLRDTAGSVGDGFIDPLYWIDPFWIPVALRVGERVNSASFNVGEYERLKEMSIDPYVALKDAYLQIRAAQIAE